MRERQLRTVIRQRGTLAKGLPTPCRLSLDYGLRGKGCLACRMWCNRPSDTTGDTRKVGPGVDAVGVGVVVEPEGELVIDGRPVLRAFVASVSQAPSAG